MLSASCAFRLERTQGIGYLRHGWTTVRNAWQAKEPMDTLMTIEEVALYLRLSKDTVYRMAQVGRIPASNVGTQWRFRREDVDQWLERNKNVARERPPSGSVGGTDRTGGGA